MSMMRICSNILRLVMSSFSAGWREVEVYLCTGKLAGWSLAFLALDCCCGIYLRWSVLGSLRLSPSRRSITVIAFLHHFQLPLSPSHANKTASWANPAPQQ